MNQAEGHDEESSASVRGNRLIDWRRVEKTVERWAWMERAVAQFMIRHNLFDPFSTEKPTQGQQLERLARLQEELSELTDAMRNEDQVDVADALGDILYLVIGTFLLYNIPVRAIFNEIHYSNMTKEKASGVNAKPVKGESFQPPRLKELLECIAKN
jgi:NTP pyrophosphatase (non-canonical NTP hydrolase)